MWTRRSSPMARFAAVGKPAVCTLEGRAGRAQAAPSARSRAGCARRELVGRDRRLRDACHPPVWQPSGRNALADSRAERTHVRPSGRHARGLVPEPRRHEPLLRVDGTRALRAAVPHLPHARSRGRRASPLPEHAWPRRLRGLLCPSWPACPRRAWHARSVPRGALPPLRRTAREARYRRGRARPMAATAC
jgi:hypothetical protein